jgi:endonuclease/exonuclease/phosphatase (EEP) superfamily protein YafD
VRLWDVHTLAPTHVIHRQIRDEQLHVLAREDAPALAIGDFNATIWNPSFRDFVHATHLRDAAGDVGRGLRTTWKGERHVWMAIPIDHILHDDSFAVRSVRVGTGKGSDHRPVVADLILLD